MSASATLRNVRISTQKARLVADKIRGESVSNAITILTFINKKSADIIKKLLHSAMANAEHVSGLDIDDLFVSSIYVNQGPCFKRMHARARGRGNRITKPTSHITIELSSVHQDL